MKGSESSREVEKDYNISTMGGGGGGGVGVSSSMIVSMAENIASVEKVLGGYRFKHPELLAEALTHRSRSPHGPNYERLEFVGDAVLTLLMSTYLYLTNPQDGPGRLTNLRSPNISTEKLARVAVRHHLYPLLLHSSPDLDLFVDEFTAAVDAENAAGNPDCSAAYGGNMVSAPKVLADVVESIIGAVYLDSNFNLETTWVFVRKMLEPIITDENYHEQPMSMLNNVCQKYGWTVDLKTRIHGSNYITDVFLDGNQVGVGRSEQMNIARLNAVRDALSKIDVKASDTPMLEAKSSTADRYTDSTPCSSLAAPPTTTDGEKEGKKNLNDLCTKNHWIKPAYRVEMAGPAHERRFRCWVEVKASSCSSDVFVTSGDFKSKVKDAGNSAAHRMLATLRSNVHET